MSYAVKEIFYTLQGEGAHAGRPAVFCRFSGCNLWSGKEDDRATAVCQFCDTDFIGVQGPGGGRFDSADVLAAAIARTWPRNKTGARPFVVCTGGEPLLQMDEPLIDALHRADFEIAIETNGTRVPTPGIDWICVSPKARSELKVRSGHELKLVFPQEGARPEQYEELDFQYFYLQPMDGQERERNTQSALSYCLGHPRWRLSLQTHKILHIP
jgi:7-carboxy-7-deazaguanine synthase